MRDGTARALVWASWVLLSSLGCGHSSAARTVQPTAAKAAPAEPTPHAAPPTPPPLVEATAPASSAAAVVEPQADGVPPFNGDHFEIVVWARDAVVDGNLETLREPLRALADHRYESVVPVGWMPGVAQLQAAARLTAEAETLSGAAAGVSAMAQVCGQCHREQGRELPIAAFAVQTKTPKSDRVESRMLRHFWAATRMWEGLVAPSDQAWRAGSAALAHAPTRAPELHPPAPGFAHALREVRELGVRASEAVAVDARARVYAQTLATCAHCHAYNAVFDF